MSKVTLNVNELNAILTKHFDAKLLIITRIVTGTFLKPTIIDIGFGGILDIEVELSEK